MNGKERIIEAISARGIKNAEEVVDYYLNNKLAKFNSVGQFEVSHGAYLDQDVLERASRIASK